MMYFWPAVAMTALGLLLSFMMVGGGFLVVVAAVALVSVGLKLAQRILPRPTPGPAPELVDRIPLLRQPLTLSVVGTHGTCAWGYHAVDHWTVAGDGTLIPKMCEVAARGVKPTAQSLALHPAFEEGRFKCECPLAGEVTFRVRHAAA